VNDLRWAGSYGVQVDFIARSHCSVEIIKTEDIMVWSCHSCVSEYGYHVAVCSETPEHYTMQAVLEKFEFFPIKCRILRTALQFSKYLNGPGDAGKEGLKTKVWFDSSSFLCPLAVTSSRDLQSSNRLKTCRVPILTTNILPRQP
jgi:hypothetical protein